MYEHRMLSAQTFIDFVSIYTNRKKMLRVYSINFSSHGKTDEIENIFPLQYVE